MVNNMKVELIENTPNPDKLVARCARGCYRSEGVGNDYSYDEIISHASGDTRNERTENLLKHLFRSGHFGPWENPHVTFAIEGISRACMAQATRHRHLSFEVQSMRYVDMKDPKMYYPPSSNSDEVVSREGVTDIPSEKVKNIFSQHYSDCIDRYQELVQMGVPKEDARFALPLGTCINLSVSGNFRSWLHFLNMRGKMDAQSEVREVSTEILNELREVAPITIKIFEEESPLKLAP
jgi:thymidylate synthase (FAD)